MTLTFKIDENDYLAHQLFLASRSARIKKKRKRSRILLPLIYVTFGLVTFFEDKKVVAFIFIGIGILWFFLYPVWERRRYVNHFRAFIRENFKDQANADVTMEIRDDHILTRSDGNESKIMASEIREIDEIPSTIFIRLNGGQSFILPKDKIVNIEAVKETLKKLAARLNIAYDDDGQWEWK